MNAARVVCQPLARPGHDDQRRARGICRANRCCSAVSAFCVECRAVLAAPVSRTRSQFDFVRSMRSGRKRAALRTARRRGKPHVREVCTAPARSVTWPGTRPYHAGSPARQPRWGARAGSPARQPRWGARAVSRLSPATRRSPRSLPQRVSGLNADGDLTKSN